MSIKKREPIGHIMTKQPVTVNTTQTLSEAYDIMKNMNIRHIPVVSGENLVGILTKSDLERVSYVEPTETGAVETIFYDMFRLDQIMTKNVKTLDIDDSVKDAAEELSLGSYHALPVVEKGKLVGIVTSTDVINYLLKQYN